MILALYRLLSPLLAALAPLAAPFAPKLAATLAWRREAGAPAWPPPDRRPRYWVHAASAGELEQARPLLAGLRAREPGAAIMLTLFSASARRAAAAVDGADLVLPLPLDTPRAMGRLLDGFRPDAVAAVKWDLWPNLVLEAERRGVPVVLLGAALGEGSRRRRWPGRLLSAPVYRRLAGVGAAGDADAARLRDLGVPAARLRVTGDTRFDRVLARVAEDRDHPLRGEAADPAGCLVAGSTWPPEEDMLLAAFAELRAAHPGLRLLLVPHEPREAVLARLEREAAARGLPLTRLSAAPRLAPGGVLVVDRVGFLAELYALGDVALVGGGFGDGVHSVLEPAAHGRPVLVGPRIGRAGEARDLLDAGGGAVFRSAGELTDLWRGWLEDPAARDAAGRAARALVASGAGAVDRSLDFLAAVLAGRAGGDGP